MIIEISSPELGYNFCPGRAGNSEMIRFKILYTKKLKN